MAGLNRIAPRAILALSLLMTAPAGSSAADPSSPPPPAPGSCAERYPEDGPAGVDLRLGCIVSEVVGLYTAGQADAPPTLSAYAIGVVIAGFLAVVAVLFAGRLLARRAGERLAPVLPGEWWQCTRCKSVNAGGAEHCYSCGGPRGSGTRLVTDDSPATPQSFGRGKHG